jgi:hypothetical protein
VLVYLEPGEVQRLLAAAAARSAQAGSCAAVAIYEQTRPDDAFGATMIANLEVSCICLVKGSMAARTCGLQPDCNITFLDAVSWLTFLSSCSI